MDELRRIFYRNSRGATKKHIVNLGFKETLCGINIPKTHFATDKVLFNLDCSACRGKLKTLEMSNYVMKEIKEVFETDFPEFSLDFKTIRINFLRFSIALRSETYPNFYFCFTVDLNKPFNDVKDDFYAQFYANCAERFEQNLKLLLEVLE